MENKLRLPQSVTSSNTRTELLRLLQSRPRRRLYVREIHRILGGSIGTLHRELRRLEAVGAVFSERVGNLKFYFANPDYPMLRKDLGREERLLAAAPLSGLRYLRPNELAALERAIHAAKAVFGPAIMSISVFGSKVRGDSGPESDLDVLIVLRERDLAQIDQFYRVLLDIELAHAARLSFKIMSDREYLKNQELGSPFVEAIRREGVAI